MASEFVSRRVFSTDSFGLLGLVQESDGCAIPSSISSLQKRGCGYMALGRSLTSFGGVAVPGCNVINLHMRCDDYI
jgi:hypothetical protein